MRRATHHRLDRVRSRGRRRRLGREEDRGASRRRAGHRWPRALSELRRRHHGDGGDGAFVRQRAALRGGHGAMIVTGGGDEGSRLRARSVLRPRRQRPFGVLELAVRQAAHVGDGERVNLPTEHRRHRRQAKDQRHASRPPTTAPTAENARSHSRHAQQIAISLQRTLCQGVGAQQSGTVGDARMAPCLHASSRGDAAVFSAQGAVKELGRTLRRTECALGCG